MQRLADRVKQALFDHFEQTLVVVLVVSLVLINFVVDYKLAFLSFYYLPIIAAGFLLGRNSAVWAAVLTVLLVAFFQAVTGLGGVPGFSEPVIMYFAPWAGFLVLTAYVVGSQSDQRKARAEDVRRTYMALLEMLTFHLDAVDRHRGGHSYRVAERAVAIGRKLGVRGDALEDLRVAGLLHELGPQDPRVARMFADFPREIREVPVAASMHAALDTVTAYGRYHELIGDDWPIDALRIPMAVKILAVADAYETLLTPTETRPAFAPWNALEEIDHSAGRTFATDVVHALRFTMAAERAEHLGEKSPLKLILTRGA
ncbi:MAG TPA: HD domain-containing protein [Gemmatimonadaceae bacterium]|nr:HD domain-containing protein [Gemmatimonadaceae bacterium]